MKTLLVTGGAGFIGSHFVRAALRSGYGVVTFDALTYAGNLENLTDCAEHDAYRFVHGDIRDAEAVRKGLSESRPYAVVNFAAETHVDRSILGPEAFVDVNVRGTFILLEACRAANVPVFVQISTDEVYGSLEPGQAFTEDTPLAPNSPYSASKAGADLLVRAHGKTYGMDVRITRCSNNYGSFQFPEKLIPLMIIRALSDQPLPVYGDGLHVRDWIGVDDHSRGVLAVLEQGETGDVFNLGGASERANIEVVREILRYVERHRGLAEGGLEHLIRHVKDRLGHDRRYAMDFSHATEKLGWKPTVVFEKGLASTVKWYLDHKTWWTRVQTGEYREYVKTQYGERMGEEA